MYLIIAKVYRLRCRIINISLCFSFLEIRLEGWLSIPNKQNIRRHGWKKQYVVVSSRKIIFYNSEADKANADPVIILNLR